MQAAADASKGSMVSIIGLEQPAVEKLCAEAAQGQLLNCANFNCPGQIVITGAVEACKRALELARKIWSNEGYRTESSRGISFANDGSCSRRT